MPNREITFKVDAVKPEEQATLFSQFGGLVSLPPRFALRIFGTGFQWPAIPLSKEGGVRPEILQSLANVRSGQADSGSIAQFVATESLSIQELFLLWNKIVLQPDEANVTNALRIIEKHISRIAQVQVGATFYPGLQFQFPTRGGFAVLMEGATNRIPVGSLGDGVWRMLSLAVALSQAKGNLFLIDEVDTGLHHTVMHAMWKLVYEAAKQFEVQVFATTHSYDCVHSLAKICDDAEGDQKEITIQRIEAGKSKAVAFTPKQIQMAAEREIEIR